MSAVAGPTHQLRKLWLSIGWLLIALVAYLSLISGPPTIDITGSDKVVHLLTYGTLMLWFLQLYPVSRRPFMALGFIAMGIVLEVLQGFTPDRDTDYLDVVANTIGVILGWLLGKTRLSKAFETVERTLSNTKSV